MKGISKKEFDKYCKEMWKRLKLGEKKYGLKFNKTKIEQEMLDEAVDLSIYAFMFYLKATKFGKK